MSNIRDTDEFIIRSTRLGKPKNRGREYAFLEKIMKDPYPLELEGEPINGFPDNIGWLYFHIEDLHKGDITPSELSSYIFFVDKVIRLAWDYTGYGNKTIQPDPFDKKYISSNIPFWANDLGMELGDNFSMNYSQARTMLHYIRFGKSDSGGHLWIPRT